MKKKRIVIISFVLVAVLAMGVGFATIADTLLIGGNFNFRNASEILGNKDAAIRFTGDVTTDPAADSQGAVSISATASDDTATLNVAVNGIKVADDADEVTPYVGWAEFDVIYDTDDTSLDPVDFSYTIEGGATSVNGLAITVTTADNKTELKVGETMTVRVTVTYTPSVAANNSGAEITEAFDIKLIYDDGTVAAS